MIKQLFILFSILFLVTGCANIVAPTGGPKDTEPPKVAVQFPKNGSTNYKENFVLIKFNENIKEDNLIYNTSISPFIDLKFKYKINKNVLRISWDKNLEENTTYTININKGIKDVTEGNTINNLSISFSTGNTIDTNQISVKNIGSIQTKLFVYENNNVSFDSLLKSKPKYSGFTNEEKEIQINYIKSDIYQYIIFEDNNNNNKIDLNEKIGFNKNLEINEKINLNVKPKNHKLDTSKIIQEKEENYYTKIVFNKDIQKIYSEESTTNINKINSKEYKIFNKNNEKTILKYIDSTGNIVNQEVKISTKLIHKKDTISQLHINKSKIKPEMDSLFIYSEYPLDYLDIKVESKHPVKIEKKNNFVYKLIITNQLPGDSIKVSTTFINNIYQNIDLKELNQIILVDKYEYYGNFKCTLETNYKEYSLYLSNSNWNIEYKNSKEIILKNLEPGTYQLKAFIDSNNNGYYDAYDPINNIAEEPIYLLDPAILIKANWDIEDIKYIF